MKEISVQELKSWKENAKDFQLIDVRDSYEYDWSNLNGESIPMANLLDNLNKINRTSDVVMYCNSGNRVAAIIDILEQKHGYTNLINLTGGYDAWCVEFEPQRLTY